MKNALSLVASLSNEQLLARARMDAGDERRSMADLIASLGEIDARGLYLQDGYSSMFAFCRRALLLSEEASYNRIEVARTARQWPVILGMLSDGRLNLTTVRLLAPHLTDENHQAVLDAAAHRAKREVEQQVAALQSAAAGRIDRAEASCAQSKSSGDFQCTGGEVRLAVRC